MSKFLGATAGVLAALGALAIVSVVFNILIWVKVKDNGLTTKVPQPQTIEVKTEPLPKPVENKKQTSGFGGIPFLNHTLREDVDLWKVMGKLEQEHAMGTLLGAMVSIDFKDVSKNSLYLSQPILPIARDFYVLPQFNNILDERVKTINNILVAFAETVLVDCSPYLNLIKQTAKAVVKFEVQIAMASWPDSAMRNYAQQYNPYTLDELKKAYPSINWTSYFDALLSSVDKHDIDKKNVGGDVDNIIITQPSYFAWLNTLFTEGHDKNLIANYLLMNMIFEESDFLGGKFQSHTKKVGYVKYALRRGKGVARVGAQPFHRARNTVDDPNIECLNMMMIYMPFGPGEQVIFFYTPGYVYVKSQENREKVAEDVKNQTELVFKHFTAMMKKLPWMSKKSLELAEYKAGNMTKIYGWPRDLFGDFKNSTIIDNYHKFLSSCIVTFPGVQFSENGTLSGCTWLECGWMEPESKAAFRDMAQCVVTQYSTQCCPQKSGNIHCANGETTQGENIADI
ncbi:unnamed protein product, partial [Strongylus vulgaris]